jgi:hypothetical protein
MNVEARFQHRRKIAKTSFILMSGTLILLVLLGLYSAEMTQRLSDLRWLITTATGLWSTLILGYYVAASYEQGRMRNDDA